MSVWDGHEKRMVKLRKMAIVATTATLLEPPEEVSA